MLTDEQIQGLLRCGNPTDEEYRLIRLGYAAAQPKWSDQPPAAPGWYFTEDPATNEAYIVEVGVSSAGRLLAFHRSGMEYIDEQPARKWMSISAPPEE